MSDKCHYCKTCKLYPDEVAEVVQLSKRRIWDEEDGEYHEDYSHEGWSESEYYCPKCADKLEEK